MDKNLFFYELEGRGYIFQNKKWDEAKHGFEDDMLNMAWEMWSSAKHSVKAQAVPELCASVEAHKIIIDEVKTEINDGYDLCQDSYLLDVLVHRGIQIGKAQAVPEGFVLVPKKPDVDKAWNIALKRIVPPPKTNDVVQKELMCKKYVDDLCFEQDRILLNYEEMIEAQESAPLKLGDLVEPIDHRYTLASGCERYPYAYVVNTNPFQLMSEEGDMYWCCTVEASGYKLIKSNDQLPEAVSLRMIREGLLSPVEAQEQSHD